MSGIRIGAFVGGCLAAFVFGWWLRGEPRPNARHEADQAPLKAELQPSPDNRTSTTLDNPARPQRAQIDQASIPQPDAKTVVVDEPTMEEAIVTLERAIKQRPIFEDDDLAFARKYQGASVAVLNQALTLLQARVDSEQDAIIQDRMTSGKYIESSTQPPIRGKGKGLSAFGVRTEVGPNGDLVYKMTEITAEEYPEFNASRMEMWWLVRTLHNK